jgi:hypothetical protein
MNFHPFKDKRCAAFSVLGAAAVAAGRLLTIYLWSFLRDKPFSSSRPAHFNVHPLQLQPVHLIAALITIYTRRECREALAGFYLLLRICGNGLCVSGAFIRAGGRSHTGGDDKKRAARS